MKPKRKTTAKKKKTTSKLMLVALKMLPSEHEALKKRALWHAQGNLSAWLRHAGLRYKPSRGERVATVTMPSAKPKRR